MTLISEINSPWWSMSVPDPLKVVTDLDDIKQCINVILKTEKGSVPGRPNFGAGILTHIDKPITQAGPNIVREIINALTLFEPRIEIVQVNYSLDSDGKINFVISWKLLNSEKINQQDIQF